MANIIKGFACNRDDMRLANCRIQAICLKTLQNGKPSFGQSETAQAARSGSGWRATTPDAMPFAEAVKPLEIMFNNQSIKSKGLIYCF